MLEADSVKIPVSLERTKVISEEDRIKAGIMLMQVIDTFSSHPKAESVLDLAKSKQSIVIPLGENIAFETPLDNLNAATLTISHNQHALDSYQLRLRERGVDLEGKTVVITQDIFWHVEKPGSQSRLGKFARRLSGKPQKEMPLQVNNAMAAVWRQTYNGDIPNASIIYTRPDQTSHQNLYATSDLSIVQQEILSKLPQRE